MRHKTEITQTRVLLEKQRKQLAFLRKLNRAHRNRLYYTTQKHKRELARWREHHARTGDELADCKELVRFLEDCIERKKDTDARSFPKLWDETKGVSGGFSADLRWLVLRMKNRKVPASHMAGVISDFIDFFNVDTDTQHLPSERQVNRICKAELDIITNAQLAHAAATAKVFMVMMAVPKTIKKLVRLMCVVRSSLPTLLCCCCR